MKAGRRNPPFNSAANVSGVFNAMYLTKDEDGTFNAAIAELDESALPDRDVTIDVEFSTINYKDGLAVTNSSPIVRQWPMIPGIDLAGTVSESRDEAFSPGDKVVLNGWEVGESYWGGLAQKARLDGSWLVPLPEAFSTEQAMAIGTAGYTAMLCVLALEEHNVTPDSGPVLVTGASGGVGSTAIAILAKLGYEVAASTGRTTETDYLTALGATEVIDRSEFSEPGKPLQRSRWAGVVDAVGSHTLANAIAQTNPGGAVAACGLAQGMDLPSSVAPFILRGVTLAGINSVYEPQARRIEAWNRMATDLDAAKLASMTEVVGLAEVADVSAKILDGQIRGRVVVDVNR